MVCVNWVMRKLKQSSLEYFIIFLEYMYILYKYYIPEMAIEKNVTLRNVNISRGKAEVENHIPKGDIFYYRPLRNVIFILLYRTLF